MPPSDRTPLPILVMPPVPDSTPSNVVLELFAPVVNVALPSTMLLLVNALAIEPTVSEKLFRFQMAPELTTTAVVSASTPAAPLRRVPSLTVVVPVCWLAPERVNTVVPPTSFVSAPVVAALAPLSVTSA